MKKLITLLLTLLLCFTVVGCANENNSNDPSLNTQTNNSTKIKLLGDIIPRPSIDYDVINSSDDSVYLEVKNATEEDFREYVDSCRSYGFDGEIMSATMPDLYYREYNTDDYFLEVRFMEDEQEFSIYICTPTK